MKRSAKTYSYLHDLVFAWRVYKAQRIKIIALAMLGSFKALFEGIGVTALIPIFALLTEGQTSQSNALTDTIIQTFQALHIPIDIASLLLFVVTLFILKFIVVTVAQYMTVTITSTFEEQTRKSLFRGVAAASWPYHMKQKIGHIENTLMNDVRYAWILFNKLAVLLTTIASLIIYAVIALSISADITVATLLFGVVIFALFKPLIVRTRAAATKTASYNKSVAHHVNQYLSGMKTAKAMNAADRIADVANGYFRKLKNLRVRVFILRYISTATLQPLSLLYIIGLFWIFQSRPGFDIAAFGVVMFLINRMFLFFTQGQGLVHSVSEAVAYVRHVERTQREADAHREDVGEDASWTFTETLGFQDVTFAYNTDEPILHDINFTIKKGETVGVIGPSGSGKTTLVDLLLRLLTPTQGHLQLDGNDAADISLRLWRDRIGYVSQDVFLTHDTIRENIRFYDENITDDMIEQAAKQANIWDTIQSFPAGFETQVGDRGVRLSGGQRQRIAIARVLARQPDVLLLDEATSALDNQSEKIFQDVIAELGKELTIVMIAHRLRTVQDCDRIVVMDDGRIVEEGTPDDLLADTTSYFYSMSHLT